MSHVIVVAVGVAVSCDCPVLLLMFAVILMMMMMLLLLLFSHVALVVRASNSTSPRMEGSLHFVCVCIRFSCQLWIAVIGVCVSAPLSMCKQSYGSVNVVCSMLPRAWM